ncbi:alpha/beta fold hydrolase [Nocardia inohanensis]|uniref:alpha/beta fold hydrolase n=1 Tax=Nocardia inohanensis TaxID=209246 RepID=UPI00082AE80E|nr:alpha/beta hydrolase [Nocardia inohanensis]
MTNDNPSPTRFAPPIGGLRKIDGHDVFVHRAGSGGPAVVFLPGASAVGLDYFGVQQLVSRFTTAVVYDRGGTGYSDPRPLTRTAAQVAKELRQLLRAENIPGPYVLAAHSVGAFYAHRFAQLYPRDVAGLVWLDGLNRDWDQFMPPAASLAAMERMTPGPEQLGELRTALGEMNAELLAVYPADLREPLLAAKASDDWIRVGLTERTMLAGLAAELRAGPGLPDVPLIALSVVGVDPQLPEQLSRQMNDARGRMDAALVATVARGEQRILSDTFHHRLCFDRPDAVAQAIRDVIARAAHP